MDINKVSLCGVIDSAVERDTGSKDKFNPVKFILRVDDCPVVCVADDILGLEVQRKVMQGMRVMVIGNLVARKTVKGAVFNLVQCNRIVADNAAGFLAEIAEAQGKVDM